MTVEQLDLAVTEGVSHFDRRDLIQAVAGLLQHGGEAAEIERTADAFLASDAVLPISEGTKEPRFTTRQIWELERKALATAERMRSQGVPPAGELIAARVIRSRPTLKADQRLGEIEAGGLFAALAERTEPIYLDQVIRHHHERPRSGKAHS